jgi:hypothetical protein
MNANSGGTIPVKLVGSPACRRYQKMRVAVLDAAAQLEVQVLIEEISEIETLSQFNPLSLPQLYIGKELVASQNPPSAQEIVHVLAGNR